MSIFKKWSPNLKETRYLASLLRGEVAVDRPETRQPVKKPEN